MNGHKKLKIGWFSFTCCEDSTIMFVEMLNDHFFEWKKLLEFRHANILKSRNELSDIDVAFVEGAIASEKDKKKLLKIRKVSKYVVAIGACAVTGLPSGNRNNFDEKMKKEIAPYLLQFHQNERVFALHELIKVDDKVPGCPMVEAQFIKIMDKYLKKFNVIKENDSIMNY
jgi:coenzyme F420-reducing hydrogenase gamma subunit